MQVWSLGQKDPLEEGMVTHNSILAWRIPWTEEPGGLHPKGHKDLDTTEATLACRQQKHMPIQELVNEYL